MDLPLLLIDIDGVISLFGFDPRQPPPGRFRLVDGTVHYLSATAAELLVALSKSFKLVWCSGWEDRADEHLPPALGVPAGLDHLSFGAPAPDSGQHWKIAAIDGYAGRGRPLAWIDDAHDDSCRAWARARDAPTELIATQPAVGLTAAHASHLRRWASTLEPVGDAGT